MAMSLSLGDAEFGTPSRSMRLLYAPSSSTPLHHDIGIISPTASSDLRQGYTAELPCRSCTKIAGHEKHLQLLDRVSSPSMLCAHAQRKFHDLAGTSEQLHPLCNPRFISQGMRF